MKPLQISLAILAFVALMAQTVRHAYMLWFEPRGSVLDKYDQPVKEQITTAASLDELVRRYDAVHKEVEEAKQERAKNGAEMSPLDLESTSEEPFKSERMLRDAIQQWEQRSKEIHEIRFYCAVAFILFLLGIFIYRKVNRWFGLTLMIAAFSELIYWTSPTFLGTTREYDRLLMNKFVLSAISLVLLIAAIWFQGIFGGEKRDSI